MARYYFGIMDGELIKDNEGTEFPDARAARHEALKVLTELAEDHLSDKPGDQIIVSIRDESGRSLGLVSLTVEAA